MTDISDKAQQRRDQRALGVAARRWANLTRIEDNDDYQVLESYTSMLFRLRKDQYFQAVTPICEALVEYLDSVIGSPADEETLFQKVNYLSYVLNDRDICQSLKQTDNGLHALVTFVMLAGLIVRTDGTVGLDAETLIELTSHVAGIAYDVESEIIGLSNSPEQQAIRMAAIPDLLFTPEWRALVEPGLTNAAHIVQAIWIDRPPLLLSNQSISMPKSPATATTLPENYCL